MAAEVGLLDTDNLWAYQIATLLQLYSQETTTLFRLGGWLDMRVEISTESGFQTLERSFEHAMSYLMKELS